MLYSGYWKEEGYFKRNRDLGQVFLPKYDFHLDALVLRLGPSDNAVKSGAPGAELFLQFFEVIGEPSINDNDTPQGTDSKHEFSKNHRCDDFIDGVTYRSIRIARGGIFPELPPTTDKYDNYHDGWALRREGDGTIPPIMTGKQKQPDDATLFNKMVKESIFNDPPARYNLSPTSEGYPDVDTYRDLEFYLEVYLNKNQTENLPQ